MITSIKVKALRVVGLPRWPLESEVTDRVAGDLERGGACPRAAEPTDAGSLNITERVRDAAPVA
jgi:hypothetical protein